MTEGMTVSLSGPFFEKDIAKTVEENAADAVKWLIDRGTPLVRGHLRAGGLKHSTGGTAAGVESVMAPRRPGSVFGVVWMRPMMTPRGGSPSYPAARVPYIINAVLESGRYAGKRNPNRKAIGHWRKARAQMEHMAARINVDLTKGLD